MKPTKEMIEFFDKRTNEHIKRVQKYAIRLATNYDMLGGLIKSVNHHDDSKFKDPEYIPYLFITWSYKCKKDGIEFDVPSNIQNKMHQATTNHVLKNPHHPEFWSENRDPINKTNRDKPKEMIDATNMPILYLAEMVADWSAMSEEHGEAGPYKWRKDNVNVRWKFSDKQVKMIDEFIDFLWYEG